MRTAFFRQDRKFCDAGVSCRTWWEANTQYYKISETLYRDCNLHTTTWHVQQQIGWQPRSANSPLLSWSCVAWFSVSFYGHCHKNSGVGTAAVANTVWDWHSMKRVYIYLNSTSVACPISHSHLTQHSTSGVSAQTGGRLALRCAATPAQSHLAVKVLFGASHLGSWAEGGGHYVKVTLYKLSALTEDWPEPQT